MKVVVPYMVYQDYKRPIEIAPDTPADILEPIASNYMGQPTKVIVPRYPIRDSDLLTLVLESDARKAHEFKLQELREADKYVPKPVTVSPPTMQQTIAQAPPRAQSRDITAPWELTKPGSREYAGHGNCVPVFLQVEGEQVTEHTRRKVYINPVRDEFWEREGERAFGLPVEINPSENSAIPNKTVLCRIHHVTPRVPLSFPIGISVKFNDEVANIKVPNNTPVTQVEQKLSVRWGVAVELKPGESTVWLPNERYEFVSAVPGQKATMTEAMIRQQEAENPPAIIRMKG
jgi:hypothetical protein